MGRVLDSILASANWLLLTATMVASAILLLPAPAAAQDVADDPLADPVARGAWLYAGNCVRCHGDYTEARLGKDTTAKQLKAKVSGEDRRGCKIAWGKARGGPLASSEIDALVDYMLAWEEEGEALILPPLPPQPTKTPTPAPTTDSAGTAPTRTPTPTPQPLDPAIQAAIDADPVAHGAWLYARHCVICHSDYRAGRMARMLTPDEVERTIEDGKTGTNMVGFGPRNGNILKGREVDAVVRYVFAWEELGGQPPLPDAIVDTLALAVATNPTPTPTPAVVVQASQPAVRATAGADRFPYTETQIAMLPWLLMGFMAVIGGVVLFWETRDED